MKIKLLVLANLLFSSLVSIAEEAPELVATTLQTLLTATQDNDLIKFQSACNDSMKKATTKEVLKKASMQVSALMKLGYKKVYMGVLDRRTSKTYYWKIDFDRDGSPDMLAELSMSRGLASGFFIR